MRSHQRLVCTSSHQGSSMEGLPVWWLRAPASKGPKGARVRGQGRRWTEAPSMRGVLQTEGRILKPPQPLCGLHRSAGQRSGKAASTPQAGFVSCSPEHRCPSECAPTEREACPARPLPAPQPLPSGQAPASCWLQPLRREKRRAWARSPPLPGARPARLSWNSGKLEYN